MKKIALIITVFAGCITNLIAMNQISILEGKERQRINNVVQPVQVERLGINDDERAKIENEILYNIIRPYVID